MAEFRVNVQGIEAVERELARLQARAANLSSPLKEISLYMLAVNKSRYQKQVTPLGKAWQPLAPSTIARRKNKPGDPGRILIDTGRLFGSIKPESDAQKARVATDPLPYAEIHQTGGIAGRGARIPQREYLGLNPDDLRVIVSRIEEHIVRAR